MNPPTDAARHRERVNGLRTELHLQELATRLVLCGARPMVVRAIFRKELGPTEIKRIFTMATPHLPGERRGRSVSSGASSKIEPELQDFYGQCLQQAAELCNAGAHAADAVCSVWRYQAERANVRWHHALPNSVKAEQFFAMWSYLQTGRLSITNVKGRITFSTPEMPAQQAQQTASRMMNERLKRRA